MKKQINVVGAVLVRDGLVLAAQRSELMALPLLWEFPGGKIEPGESPQEALRRELHEELSVQATVGEQVETTEYEYDFGVVTLTTFYCSLVGGEPTLTEHAQIRWLPAGELTSLEWAPADIPAVQKIIEDMA